MDESLKTAEEIGKLLGRPTRTILNWRKDGKIPAEICEGRVLLFDYDKVREALRSRAAAQP